ncbi:hypothetical protein J7426_12480 [Tropicibacter sp. R16_0]|nr:hypothetical protein [Tropicibacter sp. R16_0]
MHHCWIHSVLQDIAEYAKMNQLQDLHEALKAPIGIAQALEGKDEKVTDGVFLTKDIDKEVLY